ncbi:MAG: hypothetical protein WD077_02590 [Bacteroidia bacterium]
MIELPHMHELGQISPVAARLAIAQRVPAMAGGKYYTPLDLVASIKEGSGVRNAEDFLKAQADDLFMANLVVYYRKERKKNLHLPQKFHFQQSLHPRKIPNREY